MPFDIDFDGIEIGGMSVPTGKYNLRIIGATEKTSKKGDPMIVVDYEVMDGPHCGRQIKFHYVVFFKDKNAPGAGMSKSYLKTIGLPCEGSVTVDPSKWIGRCVVGKVVLETAQDGTEYPRVKFVDKYETDYTTQPKAKQYSDDEDPFAVE